MERLGRLVKNPHRVRPILQREDPVGTHPGPAHVIDVRTESEKAAMPKISKTGIYEDDGGNRFYYEEGTPITDEQKSALRYAGERERPDRSERAMRRAPENKALGPAPESRSDEPDSVTPPESEQAEGDGPKSEAGQGAGDDSGDE